LKSASVSASRSLLTGLLFCADCGSRLTFTHNTTKRLLANGAIAQYERDLFRCYRKISSPTSCSGQSSYHTEPIIEAVESEIKKFLSQIGEISDDDLIQMAVSRNQSVHGVALKQARKEYEAAKRQVNALEEQAVKALTGENQLDLEIVNSMLVKHKAKMEEALKAVEECEKRISADDLNARNAKSEIEELREWAERYDEISIEAKHMVIARLVDRIEVGNGYQITIRLKVALKQLLGKTA